MSQIQYTILTNGLYCRNLSLLKYGRGVPKKLMPSVSSRTISFISGRAMAEVVYEE